MLWNYTNDFKETEPNRIWIPKDQLFKILAIIMYVDWIEST